MKAQPHYKTRVIAKLNNSLKDIKIAKNNWKQLYNMDVKAIQQKENIEKETICCLKIFTTAKIE